MAAKHSPGDRLRRWQEVHRLHSEGVPGTHIATQLGLNYKTVRLDLAQLEPPPLLEPLQPAPEAEQPRRPRPASGTGSRWSCSRCGQRVRHETTPPGWKWGADLLTCFDCLFDEEEGR